MSGHRMAKAKAAHPYGQADFRPPEAHIDGTCPGQSTEILGKLPGRAQSRSDVTDLEPLEALAA